MLLTRLMLGKGAASCSAERRWRPHAWWDLTL